MLTKGSHFIFTGSRAKFRPGVEFGATELPDPLSILLSEERKKQEGKPGFFLPQKPRKMGEFRRQLEEIECLLVASRSLAEKSIGYRTLLFLQERLSADRSVITTLRDRLLCLLPPIRHDIAVEDEEVASQALKCLGFIIYHPDLVVAIPDGDAHCVIDSLVILMTSTRIKAICNLCVWCISIQQFHTSLVTAQLHPLLKAVIYALDNPMGSLSTTFEATQALVKLVSQTSDKMRTLSDTWAPPIYRRLLSLDKRERDMAIRCLQKIKSCILPPLPTLSKAITADMKQKLLLQLDELLKHPGSKVHALQAWGWFMRLLGLYAIKDRRLLNQMLKIPEKTFSDTDPQVQIASQVAWESLIDVCVQFLPPSMEEHGCQFSILQEIHPPPRDANQLSDVLGNKCASPEESTSDTHRPVSRFWKSIKLLMKPLLGVMSSRCSEAVRLSCLKTWLYLLHKLDFLVNHPLVILLVLEPMLSTVFRRGLEKKNVCIWKSCIDVFNDFILPKFREDQNNVRVVAQSDDLVCESDLNQQNISCSNANSFPDYSIKWMPSNLKRLDFTIKVIQCIATGGLENNASPENGKMVSDSVLRLFSSVLKVLNSEFKPLLQSFGSSLNIILKFMYDWCKDVNLKFKNTSYHEMHYATLQLLEIVLAELPNSLLVSPLKEFCLDIKEIIGLQSTDAIQDVKIRLTGISLMICMDSISAMSFLTLLYLSVSGSFVSSISNESLFHGMEKIPQIAFSVSYPVHLSAIVEILYLSVCARKSDGQYWLKVWTIFAKSLKELFDRENVSSYMAREPKSCFAVYYFLCFPLDVCCSFPSLFMTVDDDGSTGPSVVFDRKKWELGLVIDIWRSLYDSVNHGTNSSTEIHPFSEGLSQKLVDTVNRSGEAALMLQSSVLSYVFGEITNYLLNLVLIPGAVRNCINQPNGRTGDTLRLVARFLQLSLVFIKAHQNIDHSAISSVFAGIAGLLSHLRIKEDILLFMEIFSETLIEWLSSFSNLLTDCQHQSLVSQFESMWIQLLDCIGRSEPPFTFDSSFLDSQAHLFESALAHPHTPIAESSISFWMKTYSKSTSVSYPNCLQLVLDKLSSSGKLCLQKAHDGFQLAGNLHDSQWLTVKTTLKRNSKRVSLIKENRDIKFTMVPSLGLKRKRMELTEHQREVKRLQQGRERDCTGHGLGVKTYTNLDFSQGNEESQDSEEPLNADAILEKLKGRLN